MSTIKFNHQNKQFHHAIGMDDKEREILMETLAGISANIVKTEPSKSEIAETLAMTLSYRELLYLATEGMEAKTEQALKKYMKFTDYVKGKDLDMDDKESVIKAIKESLEKDEKDESSVPDVKSICVDADDIDGSLDRAGVPDEIKSQLKARIIAEMKRRLRSQDDE